MWYTARKNLISLRHACIMRRIGSQRISWFPLASVGMVRQECTFSTEERQKLTLNATSRCWKVAFFQTSEGFILTVTTLSNKMVLHAIHHTKQALILIDIPYHTYRRMIGPQLTRSQTYVLLHLEPVEHQSICRQMIAFHT